MAGPYRVCPACGEASDWGLWEAITFMKGVRPPTVETQECPSCKAIVNAGDTRLID